MFKQNILATIESEKYLDLAYNLNRFLAKNPELSGEEYKAVSKIREILLKYNFEIEENLGGIKTSFRSAFREKSKINIGVLMEYDALENIGHGCGHCGSAAISLLSFLKLGEWIKDNNLDVRLDLIGTPAEESYGAKIRLKNQGVFKDYDYLIMMHLYNKNIISPRFIAYKAIALFFLDSRDINLKNLKIFLNSINKARGYSKDFKINVALEESQVGMKLLIEIREKNIKLLRIIEREIFFKIEECKKNMRANIFFDTNDDYFPEFKNNKPGEGLLEDIYKYYGQNHEEVLEDMGFSDIGALSHDIPCFHPLLSIGMDYNLHSEEFSKYMLGENMKEIINLGSNIIASFIMKTIMDPNIIFRNEKQEK